MPSMYSTTELQSFPSCDGGIDLKGEVVGNTFFSSNCCISLFVCICPLHQQVPKEKAQGIFNWPIKEPREDLFVCVCVLIKSLASYSSFQCAVSNLECLRLISLHKTCRAASQRPVASGAELPG